LWAEARVRYEAKEKWWIEDKEVLELAAEETLARMESHPWKEMIAAWAENPVALVDPDLCVELPMVSTKEFVTINDVLVHCIRKRADTWTQADENAVSHCLRLLKRIRVQRRIDGRPQWVWEVSPV
jgi:predicted P-loop ATPase